MQLHCSDCMEFIKAINQITLFIVIHDPITSVEA